MNDMPITDLLTLGAVLRKMASKLGLSPTALIGDNGSSLISLATGSKGSGDYACGPVLRVFARSGWEMVARPISGDGIVVRREGTLPLKIVGADGGPIEIVATDVSDLPRMIQTMALANARTVSRLVKDAGTNSTGLVSFAVGTSTQKDIRLSNLLRLVDSAQFGLYARQCFRTRRQARLRAEVSRLLPAG